MTDTPWTVLSAVPCHLGESAVWDDRRGRLHWVDITAGRVYTLDWAGGPTRTLELGDLVGSVGLREAGGLVAAFRHAVAYVDPDAGSFEIVAPVEADRPGNRCNDGAVDPAGRFWFGTMDLAETDPTGAFYCLSPGGALTAAFDGIICSNGPAWSPDGRTLYHVDSTRQVVRAHDFDPATGAAGPGRVFIDDAGTGWYPDGVTVDADGYVWNCKWAGGRIVRYAPDGTVDRVLHLPVPRPTRCAFVGPDLSLLAVTSARMGLSDAELADAPLSGQVLLVNPDGPRGLPTARFAG
jgi:sugar lactone lactonase YvrE